MLPKKRRRRMNMKLLKEEEKFGFIDEGLTRSCLAARRSRQAKSNRDR